MKPTAWHNCYDGGWGDVITPESFAHPAKMAYGLLRRILQYGIDQGYWRAGDVIGDPFGGVGTTGLVGAYMGLRVVSVELEPKFVALARDNYAMHAQKWAALGVEPPRIFKGDSRNFAQIVQGVSGICTSPPYDEGLGHGGTYVEVGAGGHKNKKAQAEGYGQTPGNIGNLKSGSLAGICTSPPWEESSHNGGAGDQMNNMAVRYQPKGRGKKELTEKSEEHRHYGAEEGQVGNESGDNYWQAMSLVYAQCLQALHPGGTMAVVIKAYVKAGKIVPLPEQTWELLLHLGFQPVERVHAMLVKEHSTGGLFGQIDTKKERKSFFRRLAEKKGSPAIDWEEVLFVRKEAKP